MAAVWVIGIGPGSGDYLLPIARVKAAGADILVGGRRALALFDYLDREKIIIDRDLERLLLTIRRLADSGKTIAVLVSGDPGFYSMLVKLKEYFRPDELAVIPGVSSVQLAFARLGLPWQEARLISVHGRDGSQLAQVVNIPATVAILTDRHWHPGAIARYLLARGQVDRKVCLCCRLSEPTELISTTTLGQLAGAEEIVENCVMVMIYE